jgi:hypothetical protein
MFGRVSDDGNDIVLGSRNDHSKRIDFVETCVVREGRPVSRLEIKLAVNVPSQIVVNSGSMFIHGSGCTSARS